MVTTQWYDILGVIAVILAGSPAMLDLACPTDQYDRLASIEVGGGDGELTVHLTPRPGEHLDPVALRACMDYTLESAADKES